jgi:transcriptional regulator with XRE-family HTH domain
MRQKLPINKDILVWARTSIGLSVDDVAQKFKKNPKEIEEWELGNTSPTFSQLERLAFEIYKRPLAVFFFPDVPKEDTPKTEFRTLPDIVINELPPEMVKLYRSAKLYQLYLEELFDGEKPSEKSLLDKFSINDRTNISRSTQEIRKELDIPIEEQAKWKSTESAFKNGVLLLRQTVFSFSKMHLRMMLTQVSVCMMKNTLSFTLITVCLIQDRYLLSFTS